MSKRYCPMCDAWVKGLECPRCGADTAAPLKRRRLVRILAAFGLVLALGVGATPPFPQCVHTAHAQPLRFGVRAQDEPKPWMQGSIEIGCNRTGVQPEGDTSAEFKACSCHHRCKENPDPNDETQGRAWDASCETRCSPRRCQCQRNPCGQTN